MNSSVRNPSPPLTRSVEDYLKAIYHLSSQGGFATTSDIAAMLEVAPPSVSGMMKRLSETGLIEHVPYRGVQLTHQGRNAALQMIRRHRILEVYLTQQLGYDWGDVHAEAEQLEHAVSDKLIDRMAGALGDPRYDPHGAPIPTAAGEIEEAELVTLADAEHSYDEHVAIVDSATATASAQTVPLPPLGDLIEHGKVIALNFPIAMNPGKKLSTGSLKNRLLHVDRCRRPADARYPAGVAEKSLVPSIVRTMC